MSAKSWLWTFSIALCLCLAASAATVGTVVPIGGIGSDLALDEGRGVLYVSSFSGNAIVVISLANRQIVQRIPVAPQPSGIALSPDGRFLLVVHYGNWTADPDHPEWKPDNSLTVLDLNNSSQKRYPLTDPPVGVAYGIDSKAVVLTTKAVLLFDPSDGSSTQLKTLDEIASMQLPVPAPTFPPSITGASMGVSGDGLSIYGFGETKNSEVGVTFKYDVLTQTLTPGGYRSAGALQPKVVSVNQDGSAYMAGSIMIDSDGTFVNYFLRQKSVKDIGTTAFDRGRGLLYAQILESTDASNAPVLKVFDADNLTLRDTLQLPENLVGKSTISGDGNTLYAISESGVTIIPIGALSTLPRIQASREDLVFRSSQCDKSNGTQTLVISDVSGGKIPFTLSTTMPGVHFTPQGGVTPTTVKVTVDPAVFQSSKGTSSGTIQITSPASVNLPKTVRILLNAKEQDQRGVFVNVPGTLTDVIADPTRDRFYIIRQDANQLLAYDANTYSLIKTVRTGYLPSSAVITKDNRYLVVANRGSEYFNVFDLDTLEPRPPLIHNGGGDVRAIGISNHAILASIVDNKGIGHIFKFSIDCLCGAQYSTLGPFKNELKPDAYMMSAPDGSSIVIVQGDGTLILYDDELNAFAAARTNASAVTGAVAAGVGQYVIGNTLYNSSLVPVRTFETGTGNTAGFVFLDNAAIRFSAANSSSPGVAQRVNLSTGAMLNPVRTVEAPLLTSPSFPYLRTVAPLPNRNGYILLTTSGFSVLPWAYDTPTAPPTLTRVVNAADFTKPIAPGGLITVFGSNLSPIPSGGFAGLPSAAITDSCLQVNGAAIPVLFVSSQQINAQLPNIEGNTTLKLNTTAGTSDNLNITIAPAAPSVFRISTGNSTAPAVIHASNNSFVTADNPVRPNEVLTIYATGLGVTSPEVPSGTPAPMDQYANTVLPPQVTLGGRSTQVLFSGLTPGQIGVYQINVQLSGGTPDGPAAALEIKQGGASTSLMVPVTQ